MLMGAFAVELARELTGSAEAINLGSLTPRSKHAEVAAAIEFWEVGLLVYGVAVAQG